MFKSSLILSLSLFLQVQCGGDKFHSSNESAHLPQPVSQTSPPPKKRECDLSSFNALKAHSLPSERMAQPVYPSEAKDQKISGKVLVKVIVDEGGKVVRACAIEGDEKLRSAAEAAALESRFRQGFWNSYMAERYDYVEFVVLYNFVL